MIFFFFYKMISQPSLKSEKETVSPAQSTGLGQRRPPPEIAARWRCVPLIKKMAAHYNSQIFLSAFIIVSTINLKTPINASKLVLNLLLLFSKFCCFNFLYQSGLPSIYVWLITWYANLTSTYHPYQALSSDLSVQRWALGSCLEVW